MGKFISYAYLFGISILFFGFGCLSQSALLLKASLFAIAVLFFGAGIAQLFRGHLVARRYVKYIFLPAIGLIWSAFGVYTVVSSFIYYEGVTLWNTFFIRGFVVLVAFIMLLPLYFMVRNKEDEPEGTSIFFFIFGPVIAIFFGILLVPASILGLIQSLFQKIIYGETGEFCSKKEYIEILESLKSDDINGLDDIYGMHEYLCGVKLRPGILNDMSIEIWDKLEELGLLNLSDDTVAKKYYYQSFVPLVDSYIERVKLLEIK